MFDNAFVRAIRGEIVHITSKNDKIIKIGRKKYQKKSKRYEK